MPWNRFQDLCGHKTGQGISGTNYSVIVQTSNLGRVKAGDYSRPGNS